MPATAARERIILGEASFFRMAKLAKNYPRSRSAPIFDARVCGETTENEKEPDPKIWLLMTLCRVRQLSNGNDVR